MTTRVRPLLAVGLTFSLVVGALLACGDGPPPTPTPLPTLTPTPSPPVTPTPPPTSTPAPTPTPTQGRIAVDALSAHAPWLRGPGSDHEVRGVELLTGTWARDAGFAVAVAGLAWVGDGLTAREHAILGILVAMHESDPAAALGLLGLSWFADGLPDEYLSETPSGRALTALAELAALSPGAARAVTGMAWADAEMDAIESLGLGRLVRIAKEDPVLAAAAVGVPWFAGGIDADVSYALDRLANMVQRDPQSARDALDAISGERLWEREVWDLARVDVALAARIADYVWVADGIETEEEGGIRGFVNVARVDVALARRIADYAWVADGLTTFAETHSLHILTAIHESDPVLAWGLTHLSWFAEGIDADEHRTLRALANIAEEAPKLAREALYAMSGDRFWVREVWDLARVDVALARRIADHVWVADGVDEAESGALGHLVRVAERDLVLAAAAANAPWFADGIDADVRRALRDLANMAEQEPVLAAALVSGERLLGREVWDLARVDVALARRIADHAWVDDEVDEDESRGLEQVVRVAERDPVLASALVGVGWFSGGIDARGIRAIRNLAGLAERDSALAHQVLGYISGARLRDRDVFMMASLRALAGGERLERLREQPWFTDGLNAEERALLVVLVDVGVAYVRGEGEPDLFADLVDSHFVQSATIGLPLAGEVNLYLVHHDPFPPGDETLRLLEEAVRETEGLMGVAFPMTDVIVRVLDRVKYGTGYSSGYHNGRYVHVMADGESGRGFVRPYVLFHEVGHYYFQFGPRWVVEGGADFIAERVADFVGARGEVLDRFGWVRGAWVGERVRVGDVAGRPPVRSRLRLFDGPGGADEAVPRVG